MTPAVRNVIFLGSGAVPLPPNAPAGATLLSGADGKPLVGADGAYLWGIAR
jgi:hypothetical protein